MLCNVILLYYDLRQHIIFRDVISVIHALFIMLITDEAKTFDMNEIIELNN